MTRPRAVLFGLGGTLVARPEDPGRAIAERLGLGPDQARRITMLVHEATFDDAAALAARLASELGLDRDPRAAVEAVWSAQSAEPAIVDGAATCVGALHATGARVAVVAESWTPFADAARTACVPFATAIDHWFVSAEVGATGAALVTAALAALEVAAADALVVSDDLERDLRPALALGAGAVWLRSEAGGEAAVAVDPHGAAATSPAVIIPESAVVARTLGDVRRVALARLWAVRGGRVDLTAPLPG